MKVIIAASAAADLAEYRAYVATDSAFYARRAVKKLTDAARGLAKMPFKGRPVPDFLGTDLRQWLAGSHRIIYRVDEGTATVQVVRFFHVKRELKASDIPL